MSVLESGLVALEIHCAMGIDWYVLQRTAYFGFPGELVELKISSLRGLWTWTER